MLKEDQNKRINNSRRKIAPNSVAWEPNLDLQQHKKEYADWQQAQWERNVRRHVEDTAERERLGLPRTPPAVKPAFGGKVFEGNNSAVLSLKTIFAPDFANGREQWHNGEPRFITKELAGWPSKLEMKYEGDERIATDKLHRRFLACPRAEGNETVNWQILPIIPQYPLDRDLWPPPTPYEIWERQHWIRDQQFSDWEGVEALGMDLMDALIE